MASPARSVNLGIAAIAVSSVFSPVNTEFEVRAAEIVRDEIPGANVTLSSEIGRIGLLERENAAIMNGCLRDLALRTVYGFRAALEQMQITAPFFISQNDGTLMNADFAADYPVLTFASGPTNSMRGAAFLSGLRDAIVVDVGGTTTDIGVLQHGFPRVAALAVNIGGVRTNFRMPDTFNIGLGGGSMVRREPLAVGPRSVGYELTERALVFGGEELTATDIIVATGKVDIGDRAKVTDIAPEFASEAEAHMLEMVTIAVDRMKTSATPVPVIVVGGGSILLQESIPGTSEMLKPPHFAVANAIGAAIAQVGGECDRIFSLEGATRDEVLEQAKEEARQRAIAAGASRGTLEIVRSRGSATCLPAWECHSHCRQSGRRFGRSLTVQIVDETALDELALGAAVLGTGGGGDPYIGKIMSRQAIREYGPIQLMELDELEDDDLVVPSAMMGAPTVMVEKMPSGDDVLNAFETIGRYLNQPIRATMSIEAGGLNSVVPLYLAARLQIPLVDCDGMGRAFPELQMVTHTLFGKSATPMAMSDERGNTILLETIDNNWTETFARSITVDMGATALIALYAATVGELKECAVHGTMSRAREIGRVIMKRAPTGDKSGGNGARGAEWFSGVPGQGERCRAAHGGRLRGAVTHILAG